MNYDITETEKVETAPDSTGQQEKSNTVTRNDLADAVFKTLGTTRREAAQLVGAFFQTITDQLISNKTVKIHGFGKFLVREKGERPGRNPRTRDPVRVTARRVVRFQATGKLKGRVK